MCAERHSKEGKHTDELERAKHEFNVFVTSAPRVSCIAWQFFLRSARQMSHLSACFTTVFNVRQNFPYSFKFFFHFESLRVTFVNFIKHRLADAETIFPPLLPAQAEIYWLARTDSD